MQSTIINIRPTTPSDAIITYSGPSGAWETAFTPSNIKHVQAILNQIRDINDDGGNFVGLRRTVIKTCNALIGSFAENNTQKQTNEGLIEVNTRWKIKRSAKRVTWATPVT